jgi:hypothetical protein
MFTSTARISLPLLLLSSTAMADVAPADVWGDWRSYMEGFGYTVTGDETANGDTLYVNNLSFGMQMPEAEGSFAMTMDSLAFTQNADGSVSVVMPAVIPLTMNFTGDMPGAKPVEVALSYTQTAPAMTVSGTPDNLTYAYDAQSAALVLDALKIDGESFGAENAKMSFVLNGVSSVSTTKSGNLRDYQQKGQIQSASYDFLINNPEDPNVVSIKGTREAIAFEAAGKLPTALANAADMQAMMQAGLDIAATYTFGAGNQDLNVQEPNSGNVVMQSTSSGGDLSVEMSLAGLAYGGSQNNLAVSAQMPNLPFPVSFDMARAAFNLAMPVTKSDASQDFAFGFTMGDFTMADMIWGIFDPQGQMPRDPATIDLDLTGKAKLLFDLMDPEAAAAMGNAAPGELNAITINRLRVSAVGAEVSGTGDFTFDNADTTTYPGMPKPIGAVDLAASGLNGLIDTLVGMGFVPDQEAMGARMMLGLFTVPGSTPDTMTSRMEFNAEGHILANGQRIK